MDAELSPTGGMSREHQDANKRFGRTSKWKS